MRTVGWHRFQSLRNHLFNLCVADGSWRARAGLIQQSLQAAAPKPLSPLAHRGRCNTESSGNYAIGSTIAAPEHDASADRHSLRGLPATRQGSEFLDFFRGQVEGPGRTTRGHNSVCANRRHYSTYFSLRTLASIRCAFHESHLCHIGRYSRVGSWEGLRALHREPRRYRAVQVPRLRRLPTLRPRCSEIRTFVIPLRFSNRLDALQRCPGVAAVEWVSHAIG